MTPNPESRSLPRKPQRILMFALYLYYELKPFLPHSVRMAMRRYFARRKREACKDTWPIDEAAGRAPNGWPGWPEGKKFAFVLTHDVEGPDGLAKCQRLMKLEMELGFRSSFGFIPEGNYRVSAELRDDLTKNAFEIVVHDLYHDGSLYSSRGKFLKQALRINHHLKAWNANGFRAGFMFHNLDWLHNLEIDYDSSTFDTDPFEPQPDSVNTIFPFWVSQPPVRTSDSKAPNFESNDEAVSREAFPSAQSQCSGYVELPYTLPQDSTLFLVLRETTADIWFRKLDWIAERGGMALVNVHPDYLCFEGEKPSPRTFPVSLYVDLLRQLQSRYAGAYWHALPRQVAQHLRRSQNWPDRRIAGPERTETMVPSGPKAKRRRILMLVENNYPDDTRVWNEATLLRSAGYEISVVCLRAPGEARFEVVDGIRVYRVPRLELFKKTRAGQPGILGRLWLGLKATIGYSVEYFYFTSACFTFSCYVLVRYGFDVIHAHNPPDTLFIAALPFKLLGRKFVFDHHDLCPELYRSRYNTGECLQTRVLRMVEWCTLKLADMTIATNESYKQAHIERGNRDPDTIFIVRNGPNSSLMDRVAPSLRLRNLNKRILVYVGSLNPQDGVDYLLRSLNHLRRDLKRDDFHCVIMGSGDSLEDLRTLATELQLGDCVELTGFVSYEDLRANLAAADICVDPDPSSPLNDVSTWIKIMEYMAYGKPIVTFDLKETRFSAQDAAVYVPPNDELGFARAVAALMDAPDQRKAMGEFGRKRVEEQLQWSVVGQNLLRAYEYVFEGSVRVAGNNATRPAS